MCHATELCRIISGSEWTFQNTGEFSCKIGCRSISKTVLAALHGQQRTNEIFLLFMLGFSILLGYTLRKELIFSCMVHSCSASIRLC